MIFIIKHLINLLSGHHHLNNNNGVAEAQTEGGQTKLRWSRARKLLWAHFISGYSQTTVLIWSFWWALATGGFFMVSFGIMGVINYLIREYLFTTSNKMQAILLNMQRANLVTNSDRLRVELKMVTA